MKSKAPATAGAFFDKKGWSRFRLGVRDDEEVEITLQIL